MTDDDIRAHVMKAEGVLDEIQDKVTGQFGEARKAIMAIDRAYSQLLDSRDFYREARNELITQRDHWEHEAKEARAERDQLRRERERLRATGDQLKAENAALRDSRKRWHDKFLEAMRERSTLEADNEALRAGQGRWPDGDDSPVGDQVPRVINADELHSGASVASFTDHGTPVAGIVTGEATDKVTLRLCNDGLISLDTERRFILLADAPVRIDIPSEQVRFKGMPDLRYKGSAPAPRLTVEDLDAAGVGSQLEIKSTVFIKTAKGGWSTYNDGVVGYPSEYMIRNGWPDATLTHPEGGGYDPPTLSTDAKRFALVRDEDETGVSGTGKVAEGIIYSDDHVSMRWIVGEHRSTVAYDSITAVEAIHGHGGKTKVVIDHE